MLERARVTPTGIAVGVLATLVIFSGTAYGAPQARKLLAGKKNTTTTATKLVNTKGTPLSLKAGGSKAPLKVNSSKVVKKLNADLVDGKSAGAFASAKGRTGIVVAHGDDDVKNHAYAVAVATCPSGTILTGGGGFASYSGDSIWYSGPGLQPNSWEVDSDGDGVADTGKELVAYAVCYSSSGKAIPGAYSTARLGALKASLRSGR